MWWMSACVFGAAPQGTPPPPVAVPQADAEAPEAEVAPTVVTVLVAGDLLPHRRVKATARALDDGTTHGGWDPILADVAAIAAAADVAFLNLESPVAPDAHQGIHGEVFNAPASLVEGIAAAGFDVVSMANNHVFDQGAAGLVETYTRARKAGLSPVGAGPTCADARAPVVVERAGLRIAFVAAADLVNIDGNTTPDAPCLFVAGPVCTDDCGPDRDAVHFSLDVPSLQSAVRAARDQADLVVVSFHWGDEYRTLPLPEYPALAQQLVDAGADLVAAHHPHVLQPIEVLTAADGRRAVVAYSLGNLISDMGSQYDPTAHPVRKGDTRDGALIEVRWERVGTAAPTLAAVHAVPTWTTNNRRIQGEGPDDVRVRTHASLLVSEPDSAALIEVRRQRVAEILGEAWLSPRP